MDYIYNNNLHCNWDSSCMFVHYNPFTNHLVVFLLVCWHRSLFSPGQPPSRHGPPYGVRHPGSFQELHGMIWGWVYHLVMTNIAMENHHAINRETIYFYGPWLPWRTVSHNQVVPHENWILKVVSLKKWVSVDKSSLREVSWDAECWWWFSAKLTLQKNTLF